VLLAGLKDVHWRDLFETEFEVGLKRVGSFGPARSKRNRLLGSGRERWGEIVVACSQRVVAFEASDE
jgi:hypothetical protein